MAHYLLMDARKQKENTEVVSPSREAFRKHLTEALMMNRTRILRFKSKPPIPANEIFKEVFSESISNYQVKSMKQRRFISQVGFLPFLGSLMPDLIFPLCMHPFQCLCFAFLFQLIIFFTIDLIIISREDTRCTWDYRRLLFKLAWLGATKILWQSL